MYSAPFSEESLEKIFDNIMEWFYMNLKKSPSKVITNLKTILV